MYIMLLLIVGVIGIMVYPEFFFVTGLIFFGGAIGYMIANDVKTHDNKDKEEDKETESMSDMPPEEQVEHLKKLAREEPKNRIKTEVEKMYEEEVNRLIRKDFNPNDPEVVKEREELKKFLEEQQRKADEELEREKAIETKF